MSPREKRWMVIIEVLFFVGIIAVEIALHG